MSLVARLVPEPSDAELAEAVNRAMVEIRRNGITRGLSSVGEAHNSVPSAAPGAIVAGEENTAPA